MGQSFVRPDGCKGDAFIRAGDPSHVERHFAHEIDDLAEALDVHLIPIVGRPVVVEVCVGEKMQDGQAFSVEGGVIRGTEPVRRCGDAQWLGRGLVGGPQHVGPLLRCADAHDGEGAALQTADHVHIEHGDGLGDGQQGITDVVARTPQSLLLCGEREEKHGTGRPAITLAQASGDLDQARGSTRVVIGAVMDHSERIGIERALASKPEMIVVGSNDQDLVGEVRVRSGQQRRDVPGLNSPRLYGGREESAVAPSRGSPNAVGRFTTNRGHRNTQGRPGLPR